MYIRTSWSPEALQCTYFSVYNLHHLFSRDTSHSLVPYTYTHAVCFLIPFPHTSCSCILCTQSIQTHPFNLSQSAFPLAFQNVFCFCHSFIAYYCNRCLWKSGEAPLPWVRLNFLTASSGSGSYCHSGGQPTFHWDSLLEGKASPAEMGLHLLQRK